MRRSGERWCSLGLAFAKLDAPDFSGECLGQVVDELDCARVGVGGEAFADEGLDLAGELVGRFGVG